MSVPTRVVIYARFSPRPDEETSDSAVKQLADLHKFCESEGWPIDEALIFTDEAMSGHDWERPQLWEAIRALEPGAVLLAYNADRLARDTGILAFIVHQVQARGATIHTLEAGAVNPSDPISKFLFKMLGAFAELQRELTASRSQRGYKRNLAAGKYRGEKLPYGYRFKDRAAGLIEPDPAEQELIERIRGGRLAGMNRQEIADALNVEGETWRGKAWTRFHVRNVLGEAKRRAKRVKMPEM